MGRHNAAGRCEASATWESRRAARRVPTISTTTRAAAPRPTAAVGRPVLYLPRALQRPRVDEMQPQFLPRVHHASVSDEPAGGSSPVSVLQAARSFARAQETTIRM